VSTEGYRYDTPIFSHDGAKILCVLYPSPKTWANFVLEVQIPGGFSRKVWPSWAWLYDLSPDDSSLLIGTGPRNIHDLDLKSLKVTPFLVEDTTDTGDACFSPNGRWVAFVGSSKMGSVAKPWRSTIFVAPYRKDRVPKSEWIPISANDFDYAPRFSYDGKLIFFLSDRDRFECVWAQRLGTDMHPDGKPFAVFHSHERKRPLGWYLVRLGVGPHAVVFELNELGGNIWLLDPPKKEAH
jgi:Tol biopolymer transport system component